MPQICVTLTERTTAATIDRMTELVAADLFEVRGDLISQLDLSAILRAKTRPLLFSCRPRSEGGEWEDTETRRRMTLLEAVKLGFDYVDVEYRSPFFDVMNEKSGSGLVLSHHDEGMPEDLGALYAGMCRKGADIVKIVVRPHSIEDVGCLLDFAGRTAREGRTPLVALALGPLGAITRVIAGRYGAPFTYACAAPGAEAAAGQLPLQAVADLYRVRDVTPATEVYGILGADVSRSLSPLIHNRAFAARKVDAVYVPLEAEALEPFMRSLPALGLAGFSVTRPYKGDILYYLDDIEEAAAQCGSVNTVVIRDGRLRGSTTDGQGVLAPLKKRIDIKGCAVVVVGAGGAARSAALALGRKGARVHLLARNPARSAAAAAAVGCEHDALDNLSSHAWDVLINATPVGGAEAPEDSPVPASLHRSGSIVMDMVYDPLETRLLREARAAGCMVIDGREMLVAQAVGQFEAWTGLEAPVDVMTAAVSFPEEARV